MACTGSLDVRQDVQNLVIIGSWPSRVSSSLSPVFLCHAPSPVNDGMLQQCLVVAVGCLKSPIQSLKDMSALQVHGSHLTPRARTCGPLVFEGYQAGGVRGGQLMTTTEVERPPSSSETFRPSPEPQHPKTTLK